MEYGVTGALGLELVPQVQAVYRWVLAELSPRAPPAGRGIPEQLGTLPEAGPGRGRRGELETGRTWWP